MVRIIRELMRRELLSEVFERWAIANKGGTAEVFFVPYLVRAFLFI
jgi:hypothetical protein